MNNTLLKHYLFKRDSLRIERDRILNSWYKRLLFGRRLRFIVLQLEDIELVIYQFRSGIVL